MTRNPRFEALHPYPFEKLNALIANIAEPGQFSNIPLSLGEPKHPPPRFVVDALADTEMLTVALAGYPATRGTENLRAAIADWVRDRFGAPIDPDTEVLPVNGTREALFSFAQSALSGDRDSCVVMPNPFYQIYEGAALLAGAAPFYLNSNPAQGYQPDLDSLPEEILRKTELFYICSPGNPTGQVMSPEELGQLIDLAHRYDFIIAADECYSEIYADDDDPPQSLLTVSNATGNKNYERCIVFHSLSKRSNLPGLRSGFVAGDATVLERYFQYRTYHGCAMSPHHQLASTLAWQDEEHVRANRDLYRRKFAALGPMLGEHFAFPDPAGGFYHWLDTGTDDQMFCRDLLATYNVKVVPGSFLARDTADGNPGENHIRVAWVAPFDDCMEAAKRLVEFKRNRC